MNVIQTAYRLPDWIADEQLLRDEAVLYGLSEAQPDEKIAAIRMAFAALTASVEKEIERHQEAIGHLNLQLESAPHQSTQPPLAYRSSAVDIQVTGRFLVGLVITVLLCIGTYLGTLSLTTNQLALLVAALTGASGCVFTLFNSLQTYRQLKENRQLIEQKQGEAQKQQEVMLLDCQTQKQAEIDQLYQAEAILAQQQAQRDLLIRLFESEFDLARSLRHQVRARLIDM